MLSPRKPWKRWKLSWFIVQFLAERSASAAQCDYSLVEISEECPSAYGFDWQLYHEQLYLARSAVFSGDRQQSQSAVLQLLDAVTRRFWFAFECPLAVASTYFSLAQNFAFQGRLRRALAFIHMGFIFIRDKGFNECTPWPVQGWDMLLAGRNLVAKVRELDDESVVPTPPEFRLPKHRVAIASICAYGETEPVRLIGCENHRMDVQDGKHKPFFWKVNVVQNILEQRPRYDWILWIDCDAFFMDPGRTIDSVIHMYSANTTAASRLGPRRFGEDLQKQALRQRVEGSPGPEGSPAEVSLIVATDSSGINNGVWLMKNAAWSHDFLVRWWHSEILQGPGENHNCSDQSTMQHQLLYENSMTIDDAWDSVEAPIWVPQVRVAVQEHLQSFHAATAATVASREWQEGDFIKHHPGCHYYKPPCQQLYLEAHENFLRKLQAMR